ncbi:MAG: E3 binding domain-containing protein [Chitinophagales bacterium]
MSIAKEERVSMEELEAIIGSGKDGRVTKDDMKSYIENRSNEPKVTKTQQVGNASTTSKNRSKRKCSSYKIL